MRRGFVLTPNPQVMIQTVLELLIDMGWTTKASPNKQAIAIGHCTRLTTLKSSELQEIRAQIEKHNLPVHFVGLPTSDLLMMGRPLPGLLPGRRDANGAGAGGDHPFSRPRGTLQVVSMIRDWGLNACLGVNNAGNPFTPHGDGDPLQLACWGVGLYHAGTVGDAELLYQCVSGRARAAVGLEVDPGRPAARLSSGRIEEGKEGEEGGLVGDDVVVPYPGLLFENSEFDELPGASGAGEVILVPARRRLGIKDVVWDPPVSRRIVRYGCARPGPPDGKHPREDGDAASEEPPAKKAETKTQDAADSSL